MPKRQQFSTVRYVLIARSTAGRKLAGTGSTRELNGTRSLAQDILAMLPEADSIDIYDFQVYQNRDQSDDDAVQLQALETVRRAAQPQEASAAQ